MLRALGHPTSLAGLLLGLAAAVVAGQLAQRAIGWLLRVRFAPSEQAGALRYVDPFGIVAAAIGGVGWGTTLRPAGRARAGAGRACLCLLAAPIGAAAAAAACLVGYVADGGSRATVAAVTVGDVLPGALLPAGQAVLLCAGLEAIAIAILLLVPLPPLPGWRVLCTLVRPTLGWQRVQFQLEERNIGVAILLAISVIPPSGPGPILVRILDAIVGAILNAAA
ncbi:MAG: hypothetical protein DLM56_09655 [Pseudonocardiales bacterium]|nr:MAG: hypothetical protein DLM56_09655 [Pseudonocardiales bacterium]